MKRKNKPIVLFAVTIAENLQNMKPVQNCTSLIFWTFHEVVYIFKKAKGSGNGFQDQSSKFLHLIVFC